MFLAAEVRRDSRAHNDGAGPTLGSFMCMLSLPLRTSKSWIWSLHQPSIIATLSGIEYVSWGDLCTTLEATGRTTEAEARGPGGIMAGSALHRLVGVAPPGPCSLMHAAQHHSKAPLLVGGALHSIY